MSFPELHNDDTDLSQEDYDLLDGEYAPANERNHWLGVNADTPKQKKYAQLFAAYFLEKYSGWSGLVWTLKNQGS